MSTTSDAGKLTPEQIDQNWFQFRKLCEKTGDRAPAISAMLDELDIRLCMCPASAKRDYHLAVPGGLCDHSLRVLANFLILNREFNWQLDKSSMIISALFHDIGKVGLPGKSSEFDFYRPQTDQWRLDKMGEEYFYNNDLITMTTSDRSVFLLQHYQIKLTPDEWLSIRYSDGFGPNTEMSKNYGLKISPLVYGVLTADYIATMSEKNVPYWPRETNE
jgi:hypothetical protein